MQYSGFTLSVFLRTRTILYFINLYTYALNCLEIICKLMLRENVMAFKSKMLKNYAQPLDVLTSMRL